MLFYAMRYSEHTPRSTTYARGRSPPTPSQLPFRTGTSVLKESKSAILQLPVVHKLSISHDLPNLSVPCPVTGQADLQGTSPHSRLLPIHLGLFFDQELHY